MKKEKGEEKEEKEEGGRKATQTQKMMEGGWNGRPLLQREGTP